MFLRSLISPISFRLLGHASIVRASTTSSVAQTPTYTAIRNKEFVVLKNNHQPLQNTEDVHKFPLIWLRENCQCSQCFHSGSASRMTDWTQFDVNVQPVQISFNNDTANLHISWSDAHQSEHQLAWLRARSFNAADQREYRRNVYRPVQQPWTARTFAAIAQHNRFQFDEIIGNDGALREWLHHMAVHGVAFVRNASGLDAIDRLTARVAFMRPTHYGSVAFNVRKKSASNSLSFLSVPLQMHTDLPYYEQTPGLNMLHCVTQAIEPDAGCNLLADGLTVVEQLRSQWPEHFVRLSQIEVDWLDVGVDQGFRFHKRFLAPVISLDTAGHLRQIRQSIAQRDSRFTCALEDVEPWYRAYAKFIELLYASAVTFQSQPGDILMFDNARMVHGRTAFVDVPGNARHLVGAFMDWDEVYSRLRVLEEDNKRQE